MLPSIKKPEVTVDHSINASLGFGREDPMDEYPRVTHVSFRKGGCIEDMKKFPNVRTLRLDGRTYPWINPFRLSYLLYHFPKSIRKVSIETTIWHADDSSGLLSIVDTLPLDYIQVRILDDNTDTFPP